MGDPKRQRKKFESPKYRYSRAELDADLKLLGEYGLRNKRELWRHHFMLTKYRTLARKLLGMPQEERIRVEKPLLGKLYSLKIVSENATLDDILDLSIGDILDRRLQTLVFRCGLTKTPQQARQLVTHGHISIKGQRITSPSYIVAADEEEYIEYAPTSTMARADHPLRKELITPATAGRRNQV